MTERKLPNDALGEAIASLEAQRPVLGNAIVDAALAPLLAQQHASHHTAPPRRRQVSVLFLDVVDVLQALAAHLLVICLPLTDRLLNASTVIRRSRMTAIGTSRTSGSAT